MKKLMNPGPAISIFWSMPSGAARWSMMVWATLRGGMFGLLGQDQGQVGGQVAVLGVFGGLHFEGGQGLKGQLRPRLGRVRRWP